MQPPPRLDLGNPPPKQPQGAVPPPPPHFPPPPYREEAALPVQKKKGLARILPTLVTFGAFGGLALLAWFAYQEGKAPIVEEELPVIKAEEEPYKRAPENPGGEEIPHTDKEVYNSFTSDKPLVEAKKAEPVPDAEQPIDRAFIKQFTGDGEEGAAEPEVKQESVEFGKKPEENAAAEEAPLEPKPLPLAKADEVLPNTGGVKQVAQAAMEAAKEKAAESVEAVQEVPLQKPAQALADAAENMVQATQEEPKAEEAALPPIPNETVKKVEAAKKPETEKKQAAPVAKKPAASAEAKIKGPRLQLGAFRSEAEANREWKKMQAKHPSLLGKHKMIVQKVEIPNKGTMYRLQVASVKYTDIARSLCKKLVAAGQGCFIAK